MIEIKKFTETDTEFQEICRVENLIRFDSVAIPEEKKRWWQKRNKEKTFRKLLLYCDNNFIGVIHYCKGIKENQQNCYFSIYLDPQYQNDNFYETLYNAMLEDIRQFKCNKLFPYVFEHPNYKRYEAFLLKKDFKVVQINREYSLNIEDVELENYFPLINKLESKGIKIYDSKYEMQDFPNHYQKLEELEWIYSKDIPRPEGIAHTRDLFEEFMKELKDFYKYSYGVDLVAVKDNQYIGGTYLEINQGTPTTAWTGSLGVLRDFRRQGIATALKIKAIDILKERGIKDIRTDNEKNNPMYKINVALGFKPVPFCIDYMKEFYE